jgi:NitT/TauT family transport system ATP-binding protein
MLPLQIQGRPREACEAVAREQLGRVGLAGFERKYPWQLSGGMQQRVSIARALALEPALLLMDEPFGALDEITRDHLNEQLLRLWERTGKTVVFVTHSISEAVFLANRIVVMSPRPGRIIEIIDNPIPGPRKLDVRDSPEFAAVAQRVREALRAGHSYE